MNSCKKLNELILNSKFYILLEFFVKLRRKKYMIYQFKSNFFAKV
jgi:hypothetical protein